MAKLFDGRHDDVAILRLLPRTLTQLFTPAFMNRIAHPDGALLSALRANDTTCDWKPAVSVRLHAAHGDRRVVFDNAKGLRTAAPRARRHGAGPQYGQRRPLPVHSLRRRAC